MANQTPDTGTCTARPHDWPRGKVVITRPARTTRRRYSPQDLARIYRYVSCTDGEERAICAVMRASGKGKVVREALDRLDEVVELIEEYFPEDPQFEYDTSDPYNYLSVIIIIVVRYLNEILSALQKSGLMRIARYLLRKVAILSIISRVIGLLLDALKIQETLVKAVEEEIRPLLESCSCIEEQPNDSSQDQQQGGPGAG